MASTPEGRPPTILSPYGEGYCRTCRFVIGLDHTGRLDQHTRANNTTWGDGPTNCKGSGAPPPKLTPYASEKNRFKTVPRLVDCHICGREVKLTHVGGGDRLPFHLPLVVQLPPTGRNCLGSNTPPREN